MLQHLDGEQRDNADDRTDGQRREGARFVDRVLVEDELTRQSATAFESQNRGQKLEHAKLESIKVGLDQSWDLLRQRRALREAGYDADAARVRDPEVVERYEQ